MLRPGMLCWRWQIPLAPTQLDPTASQACSGEHPGTQDVPLTRHCTLWDLCKSSFLHSHLQLSPWGLLMAGILLPSEVAVS